LGGEGMYEKIPLICWQTAIRTLHKYRKSIRWEKYTATWVTIYKIKKIDLFVEDCLMVVGMYI
jgi:hypothetical protein